MICWSTDWLEYLPSQRVCAVIDADLCNLVKVSSGANAFGQIHCRRPVMMVLAPVFKLDHGDVLASADLVSHYLWLAAFTIC